MSLKTVLQGRKLAHPLHPFLVHFPIGLWLGSLVFDIISMSVANPAFGHAFVIASYYCMLIGVISAGIAAITGLADFVDIPQGTRQHPVAVTHMTLNVLIVVGYIIQLVFRDTQAASVSTGFFIFNLIEILVLAFSGYLGGKMVFTYRVGSRAPERAVTAEEKPRRIA